jgi:hypothetical protein
MGTDRPEWDPASHRHCRSEHVHGKADHTECALLGVMILINRPESQAGQHTGFPQHPVPYALDRLHVLQILEYHSSLRIQISTYLKPSPSGASMPADTR